MNAPLRFDNSLKVIFDADDRVAEWAFKTWGTRPFHVDLCVGLARRGKLVGAFAFNHWNGVEAEVHFLGPSLLRKDVVRLIFVTALRDLGLHRMVARTKKESIARGYLKLGAEFECVQRCVYGPEGSEDTRQYVFYRPVMEQLAQGRRPRRI